MNFIRIEIFAIHWTKNNKSYANNISCGLYRSTDHTICLCRAYMCTMCAVLKTFFMCTLVINPLYCRRKGGREVERYSPCAESVLVCNG